MVKLNDDYVVDAASMGSTGLDRIISQERVVRWWLQSVLLMFQNRLIYGSTLYNLLKHTTSLTLTLPEGRYLLEEIPA